MLISPQVGGEEWSAQRTGSQLLGCPNDERRQGRGRAPWNATVQDDFPLALALPQTGSVTLIVTSFSAARSAATISLSRWRCCR